MHTTAAWPAACDPLVAYFGDAAPLRSRSVSARVLTGTVDIPAPPARLLADWAHDAAAQLALQPGDVEALPLARARARWPDYRHCVQAAAAWLHAAGLQDVLAGCDVALMACRGAHYHHDANQYAGSAFCNLFVTEDKGLDLHFATCGQRIALQRGTLVVFDTAQPHAVIDRGGRGFRAIDFAPARDCLQVFLTWELPITQAAVARAMGTRFDIAPAPAGRQTPMQVLLHGTPARVCPDSGVWLADEEGRHAQG